jgi:tetratricopeptide (TPR) repeat protein
VAVILIATFAAYAPALRGGFIWDDEDYVTGNPLLKNLDGLGRIWFDVGATPQYYPLVHTTFWIEYHLWGLAPTGYHATNILLHATAALLLWTVLRRLGMPGAWLAAAVFALHPVQVESAAWITERKNVLSAALYLSALLCYARFAGISSDIDGKACTRWPYALALVLFSGALLAKTVTCTLPAAILLLIWWKRGRIGWRDVRPLIPMLLLGIVLGGVTAWLEKHHVGAQGAEWQLSWVDRCLIAGRALWFYASKLVWPTNLTFIYPRWHIDHAEVWQYAFPASALLAVAGLWLLRRRIGRGPLAAVLFFTGTLGPALGFIDVYPMRYSFVADHFQYLASIGLIVLAVGVSSHLARRRLSSTQRGLPAVALLIVLGVLTWRQTHVYTDLETLWTDTLAKNPSAWIAHNNLAVILTRQGKTEEAQAHYRTVLELKHDHAEAYNNLGNLLTETGQPAEAISHYEKALRILPDCAELHYNFADTLASQGRTDEAIHHFEEAARLKPPFPEAHRGLAELLAKRNQTDAAIQHYQLALQARPDDAGCWCEFANLCARVGRIKEARSSYERALGLSPGFAPAFSGLGILAAKQGDLDAGMGHFRNALRADPRNAESHYNLANLLLQAGRSAEAVAHYHEALAIKPGSSLVGNRLAWVLATSDDANVRNGPQAVNLAEQICPMGKCTQPEFLDTLAAAYAEAGRFDRAVDAASRALESARGRNPGLADRITERLDVYRSGNAYHKGGPQ